MSEMKIKEIRPIGSAEFLVRLLGHFQGSYPCAAAISGLLHRQADLAFVPVSHRELSALIGERVSAPTMFRTLMVFEETGVIEAKTHPNTTTRYRINPTVLRTLVDTPAQEADVMPGITFLPDRLRHNDALSIEFTLIRFDAISDIEYSARFFVELLNRLDLDYSLCSVLFALHSKQIDSDFVRISHRDLSASLGGSVLPRTTLRSLSKLESIGLIERDVISRKHIRYRVNATALRSLLATPIPAADVIPGVTPLPALERLFAADLPGESLEPLAEGSVNG